MSSAHPVILLELNELVPSLMERFIQQGRLPNFARLQASSQVYITDAEERAPQLEPWIQWITVHCGMRYADHKIFNLGDSARTAYPSLWDLVSRSGRPVWVCGSMNASHEPDLRGKILPDPWSVHVRPNDDSMLPYFNFVRANVLEHTRDDMPFTLRDYASFLKFMATHGLRASTVASILWQLASEKLGPNRWRRATILDRLQLDLFRHVYRKTRPAFSTFFLNSTAHFQHMYWREFEPAAFPVEPDPEYLRAHSDAIPYGYEQMDRIVGDILDFVGDDAIVAFGTALSQQPCLKYEASGGKTFYKPIDYPAFLRFSGIDPRSCVVEPVMSEEFHVRFQDEISAQRGFDLMGALRTGSREAVRVSRDGTSLLVGCAIFDELPPDAGLKSATGKALFTDVFYRVDLRKSGMHHHDGMFWVRVPGLAPGIHPTKVPLVDVAPTLLSLMGLPAPSAMPGRALIEYEADRRTRYAA